MKHKVTAYHLGKRIKLKVVGKAINGEILKSEHSFLLYKFQDNSLCYIKDYGSIVFIDTNESFIKTVIESILNEEVVVEDFTNEKICT